MGQHKVSAAVNSFMFFLFAVLMVIVGAGGARAQTGPGVWKCYHKVMFPNVCGESGQGTAVDDYYAVKWPFSDKLDAPSCFFKNNSTEWCEGYYTVKLGNPSQKIKSFARGAADLYCQPGTIARQGLCVVVADQGESCPITPGSAVDPLSGRSHRQESDGTAGATAASRGISNSRTDAQSANDFRIDLTRYYSSKYESLNFPFSSRLGVGWRTAYDTSAVINGSSLTSATLIHVILPYSAEYSFLKQAGGWKPVLPRLTSSGAIKWDTTGPGVGFVLTTANNQIVLRSPDGSEYVFDISGRLIQLRSATGYAQTLEYTGKLNTRVFDTLGGWIRFNYAHPTQPSLLSEAETSDGARISYSYENRYLDSAGQRAAAEHSGFWTLKSVSYSGTALASVPGSRDRYYEYLSDRARPFLLTGVFARDGARLAGWTYDTKGRATSREDEVGINHWSYSYDELLGNVNVTDPMGLGVVYSFGTGPLGIKQLLAIDGNAVNGSVFYTGNTSRRSSPIPHGKSTATSQSSGSSQVCFEDCAAEIQACGRICQRASSDPNMPNIWSGALGRCMRGCVSANCGGNKV